jgi:murein L,D-transpeptidase YcbB/YkuD
MQSQRALLFRLLRSSITCILPAMLVFHLLLPISLYAKPTEAELAGEMAKHLVCYPMDLLSVQQQLPTLATRDLCLATIYLKLGTKPLWVSIDGPTPKADIILSHLQNSFKHGLEPDEFEVSRLLKLWNSENAEELALLDTILTYNLVKYVHDISYGQLKPLASDPALFAEAGDKDFNPVQTIEHILATSDVDAFLLGLPPQHQHYLNLMSALAQYREIAAQGDWSVIAEGNTLRPNDQDPRVIAVRERLKRTADLSSDLVPVDPEVYDSELEIAVLRFQHRHGLDVDGVIGSKTLAALNVPVRERVDTLRINMARWRWHAHDLGNKYVLVNIASYNLKAYEGEGDILSLDIPVIVGKEQHQTPVFSDRIKYIDINPFWNITPSIARNEELPELRKNPRHLVERNVRLFSSWQSDAVELDSTTINWHAVSKSKISGFKLRQDPGPWNALGKIKFVFPNHYSVYMHDTPAPSLFNRTQRDFSHGCIRVSDPLALAIFLLKGQNGGWDEMKVKEAYNQTSRKVIQLSSFIPVHITYQTTWVDKDGTIHFNNDIYARDAKLYNALLK